MKYIERLHEKNIEKHLVPQKVLLLLGARRTGKTVLIQKILEREEEPYLFLNGENVAALELLDRQSTQHYLNVLGGKKLLVIDEAQNIPEIGQKLKLMVDSIEGLRILATGSSAFNISKLTGAPLTGRKITLQLFPLCEEELMPLEQITEKKDNLHLRLIYGSYPELWQIPELAGKTLYLQELVDSYLMKDILAFENVQNSLQLYSLLRLLAFQVGKEVSFNELARQLGMSVNTIIRYLDLFAKAYIIFPIGGFSRNLRKEIVKSSKWYFYDNGIRNALVANFNPLELRNDKGELWENYIVSERIKFQHYSRMIVNNFFWRTYDRQEIDWVEERDGKLYGYEMKWSEGKQVKAPSSWQNAYPDADFRVITPESYQEWVINK